jgi:hypothetical protein
MHAFPETLRWRSGLFFDRDSSQSLGQERVEVDRLSTGTIDLHEHHSYNITKSSTQQMTVLNSTTWQVLDYDEEYLDTRSQFI